MSVREAAESLEAAFKTLDGLAVYRDPSARVDPPGVILGPPSLTFEGYCIEPTHARFTAWAVTSMQDRTLEKLWDLVPRVARALDGEADAVVTSANPGVFNAGGTDLPCYELAIEVSL